MSPAERFAACMAEAGFPIVDVQDDPVQGVLWSGGSNLPYTEASGRAVHRAMTLVGGPLWNDLPCEDCYAAWWADDDSAVNSPQGCEHVEVSA